MRIKQLANHTQFTLLKIMKSKTNKNRWLEIAFVLAGYSLLFIDIFFFPDIVAQYLMFDVKLLPIGVVILLTLMRIYGHFSSPEQQKSQQCKQKNTKQDLSTKTFLPSSSRLDLFWKLHDVGVIIAMCAAMLATGLEYAMFRGFVYSQIGVHFSYFTYLAMMMLIISLLNKPLTFFQKRWKLLVFLAPFLLMLIAFLININHAQLFRWLVEEDSLVEWLQFTLLTISSITSIFLSKKWWKDNKILGVLFALAAAGMFFVAGEEISWGQRLLRITTPDTLQEINIQDELTVHNIGTVFGYVYRGYMIIGLLGSTAWIIKRVLWRRFNQSIENLTNVLVPDWYYFWYFIIAFIKNFDRIYISQPVGEVLWEEPMELLLVLGIFIFLIERCIKDLLRNKEWTD